MRIPFNKPLVTGKEEYYIHEAMNHHRLSGDGIFTAQCHQLMEDNFHCRQVLLTTSCTHALEMTALLAGIRPGDEVIMPSYTFVSTANAFVLRGARIIFIDIRPDTMNMDETLIENAISDGTRAIVPVHYAGVACEMDTILAIARRYNLLVIEDAAQAVMSQYRDRYLGTIGDLGAYSFHESKNITCGEGGALLVNSEQYCERAEIVREKGTDRSRFFRGQVDKYTWVDMGSSYLPSELNAAYLYAQLEMAATITRKRLASWRLYYEGLKPLAEAGYINLPVVPPECQHNAHMFYIKVRDCLERNRLIEHLQSHDIGSVFHYIPLHDSVMGSKWGRFNGEDRYTTSESERLLRLPLYYNLADEDLHLVVDQIIKFYDQREC